MHGTRIAKTKESHMQVGENRFGDVKRDPNPTALQNPCPEARAASEKSIVTRQVALQNPCQEPVLEAARHQLIRLVEHKDLAGARQLPQLQPTKELAYKASGNVPSS